MTTFPHLRAAVLSQPWAILPDRLEAIAEVLERRFAGVKLDQAEIEAIRGNRPIHGAMELFSIDAHGIPMAMDAAAIEARGAAGGGGAQNQGGVIAVINVNGVIAQHAHQVDNISGPGGTSVERVQNSLRAALADPNVVGIIFKHDSPGGNVAGVQGLADEIYAARGRKPMVAQVDSMMASASYWLGAPCDEIVMSPGAMAGSIGVYTMHKDVSGLSEKMGVKMSFISAGKYKVEGHPYEPLADEAAQAMQETVDAYYSDFAGSVAKFRGVKMSDVQNGFGEGRMLKDKSAVKAGLADRVDTFDNTLRRMASSKMAKGGAKASGAEMILAIANNPDLTDEQKAIDANKLVADGVVTAEEAQAALAAPPVVAETQPEPVEAETTEKVDETATRENDIAAQEAAERDAFRRRRHALRLRKQG